MSANENFSTELAKITDDPRLAKVCRGNAHCALFIWLLELKDLQTTEYRILYSWIIPSSFHDTKKWYMADGGMYKTLSDVSHKYRFPKLTLYHTADVISKTIEALAMGKSLLDSCIQAGAPLPNKRFADINLSKNVSQDFSIGPVLYCPVHNILELIKDEHLPSRSPIAEIPTFSVSIVCIDKLQLWSFQEKWLTSSDEIAKDAIEYLSIETGFDFMKSSCTRIGNLEWLAIAGGDEQEQPDIMMEPSKLVPNLERRGVDVILRQNIFAQDQQLAIRCRAFRDAEIISDELIIIKYETKGTRLRFLTDYSYDRAVGTVWVLNSEGLWLLWHENMMQMLMRISGGLGITGLSATVQNEYLDELMNSKARERADAAKKVQQVNYHQALLLDRNENDLAIKARTSIKQYVRRKFPNASGGGFFQKGWNAGDTPGLLSFMEWFRSLTSTSEQGMILIVDPFFDNVGIDLIARATSTQLKYVVLTNTQVKTIDDNIYFDSPTGTNNNQVNSDQIKPGFWTSQRLRLQSALRSSIQACQRQTHKDPPQTKQKPRRVERIQEACKKLKMILSSLDLTVLDLKSNGGGNNQLFHDRYILLLDGAGHAIQGFNLSNSIQGATKHAPLLVTPIPEDLLRSVHIYVEELISAAAPSVSEATVVELFNSIAKNPEQPSVDQRIALLDDKNIADLFALLLEDPAIASLRDHSLRHSLEIRGALTPNSEEFLELADFSARLASIMRIFENYDEDFFSHIWRLFAEWRIRACKESSATNELAPHITPRFAERLQRFLIKVLKHPAPSGLLGIPINRYAMRLVGTMRSGFVDNLKPAAALFSHGLFCYGLQNYSVGFTAKLLMQSHPDRLVCALHQAWDNLPAEVREKDSHPVSQAFTNFLCLTLREIVSALATTQNQALQIELLRSSDALMRAVGAQSLFARISVIDTTQMPAIFQLLTELNPEERIFIFAYWLEQIRLMANRKQYVTTPEMDNAMKFICEQIYLAWPQLKVQMNLPKLRLIVDLANGPGKGPWISSTDVLLFQPLVLNGSLSQQLASEVWLSMLFERIENLKIANFDDNDLALIQVVSVYFLKLSIEYARSWLERIIDIKKQAMRTVQKPFMRTKNYETWVSACRQLLWIQTFLAKAMAILKINKAISELEVDINLIHEECSNALTNMGSIPEEFGFGKVRLYNRQLEDILKMSP